MSEHDGREHNGEQDQQPSGEIPFASFAHMNPEDAGAGPATGPDPAAESHVFELDLPDQEPFGAEFIYIAPGEDEPRKHWHDFIMPDQMSILDQNRLNGMYNRIQSQMREIDQFSKLDVDAMWQHDPEEAERVQERFEYISGTLDKAMDDLMQMVCPDLVENYPRRLGTQMKLGIANSFFTQLENIKNGLPAQYRSSSKGSQLMAAPATETGNRKQRRRNRSRRQRGEKP